jgi:hypothetical protein
VTPYLSLIAYASKGDGSERPTKGASDLMKSFPYRWPTKLKNMLGDVIK